MVRATVGVPSTDGGPPRGVRGRHGIASFPSEVEFDGPESANATDIDALRPSPVGVSVAFRVLVATEKRAII